MNTTKAAPASAPKKYTIEFDWCDLVDVEISETAADIVKEMVDFCNGAQEFLDRYNGDYNRAFCHRLALFILEYKRIPSEFGQDDEGYYTLDGSLGVKVSRLILPDIDEDQISVKERTVD